jgi:hypothetical protein
MVHHRQKQKMRTRQTAKGTSEASCFSAIAESVREAQSAQK